MLATDVATEEDRNAESAITGAIVTETTGHGETEIMTTIEIVAVWSSAGRISAKARGEFVR